MRIVAGRMRGKTIEAPTGDGTRPTTDRVREALFSSLYSLRGGFDGAVVLDAFAGSGALGLEALSRGARSCTFVERDRSARKVLEMVRRDRTRFQAIEIMACPGGCINGGGQPYIKGERAETLARRMEGLYAEDAGKPIRLSHENPDIKKLYAEYLGEPGSEKAHHLLHTVYHENKRD